MSSTASSPQEYLFALPAERKEAMTRLRNVIAQNLPEGFTESISNGMLGFGIPKSRYPAGYHANPETPLPFVSLASQKNFIALYHMGLYGMPELLRWFRQEYPKHSSTKLDMGKSCVRFKKPEEIPYQLIGELMKKVSPSEWIACYESNVKK